MVDINLLSSIEKENNKKAYYFKLQFFIFLAIFISILFFWHMVLQKKIDDTLKKKSSLQEELRVIDRSFDGIGKTEGSKDLTANIKVLEKRKRGFFRILSGILQGVSKDLYLSRLSIKEDGVKIIGQTKSIFSLTNFIRKLTNVKCRGVPIIQKIDNKDEGYCFVLLWGHDQA